MTRRETQKTLTYFTGLCKTLKSDKKSLRAGFGYCGQTPVMYLGKFDSQNMVCKHDKLAL